MTEHAERYTSWVCSRHQSKTLCCNWKRNTEPAVFRKSLEILNVQYVNEELANLDWERESRKQISQSFCSSHCHSGSSAMLKGNGENSFKKYPLHYMKTYFVGRKYFGYHFCVTFSSPFIPVD